MALLDFHVADANALPLMRALARRDATQRLLTPLASDRPVPTGETPERFPPRGWLAALFLAALSFLWIESRWKATSP